MKHFATALCMACAATAFASAGDAHAVDWTAVGHWTVLVFCAIVLARPLCAGLRALARLAVPALFAFLLLSLGMFATTPNGGTPTREEKERIRDELAAAEAERAALAGILTGGTRSGDATNGAPTFAFTMVGKETNRVEIASVWTPEYVFSAMGLYYSRWIESNDWARIDLRTDVSGETNCAWTITDPTIVTNKAAFFDARGFLADDDSDADGVPAAREIELGLDPDLSDTDGDLLSDGEELGSAELLSGDGFLWLDSSNGVDGVSQYTSISGDLGWLWLSDGSIAMQETECADFEAHKDGFFYISRDGNDVWTTGMGWTEGADLRHDARSGGAIVVAALNWDMAYGGPGCRSIAVVETNGTRYVVYRAESQNALMPGLYGLHPVTYEVIVPFDETNTVYVSYLEVDEAVSSLSMDLGVQCPSMRSAMNTNELYTIPAPPGALRPRTTVKYVLGRNTDPRLSDTDGDGIPDGYSHVSEFDADGDGLVDPLDPEPAVYGGDFHGQSDAWVQATFTNASDILSVGYPQWVDSQVGVGLANGLCKLTVSVTNMPATATRLAVGGYDVMVDAPCELVFLLDVFEEYGISVSAPLAAEWSCDDGFGAADETFEAHFTAPAPGADGSLRIDPLVVVSPSEVALSQAAGTVLAATWNVASAVFSWSDQGGTATFSGESTNTAVIASAPDATVLSVVADDGTHSATGTVAVVGSGGGGGPPEEPREDASLGWSDGNRQTGTPPHPDTLRTTWVAVVGDRPAGEPKETAAEVSVPAGRTCYLAVFGRSTEHPAWTGASSQYNDALRWSVRDGTTPVISGSCRVNAIHAAFSAAADGGDSADGESLVVFLGGAFHSAPTNAASTLSVSLRALNVGDGKRPSALALGVFPLSVYQTNHPQTTGVGGTTDLGLAGTNAVIGNCGVAYVTGAPAAAELLAKIRDLPAWLRASWSGTLTSERSERGELDDRTLATNVTAGAANYDIKAALTNEVIGGRLDLSVQVSNTTAKTVSLFIRGKNPLDATVRAYIDANVDEEFRSYAWMIAKHESKAGDRVYNQFNPSGSRKELPNWGTPYGWGMSQIDKGIDGDSTAEVYDWHANIASMNAKLQTALNDYNRFIGYYRTLYQNDPTTQWSEPDDVSTLVDGYDVSAEMWSVLTFYNGAGGCPRRYLAGAWRLVPVEFDPVTTNWIFYANSQNYVGVTVSDRNQQETE